MENSIRDVREYFQTLSRLLNREDWNSSEKAASLLSVEGSHSHLPYLHVENYATRRDRAAPLELEAFDLIACMHLHVLYHIHVGNNYDSAFKLHTQLVQMFNKEILLKIKDENYFMPILYQLCSDLRHIAKMADAQDEKDDEEGENSSTRYELSIKSIMESYRTCVTDGKGDPSTSKKVAILNLTNHLFRIYFKINKLNLLKPLIRAVDNAGTLHEAFSMADKVTYNYFLGRKAMFDSDLSLAEKSLSYAFRNCPSECIGNKRRVLVYLIPVKMFLGHMPTSQLLHKFQLDDFIDVVDSVKEGNLEKLDRALQSHESFFIECGIFLMLEKLRAITFRTLFKKVSYMVGGHQISLENFLCAVHWMGMTDIDSDELECIVANLIAEKKIKGYISHQHQKLVVSKMGAFPALSSFS